MVKIQVICGEKKYSLACREDKTILSVLQENGITSVPAPCGGRGRCGKCVVKADGVLKTACTAKVSDGMEVLIPKEEDAVIAESGEGHVFSPDEQPGYFAACDIGTTTVVCHLLDQDGRKLATAREYNSQRESGADIVSRIRAPLSLMHEQMTAQITRMLTGLMKKADTGGQIKRLAVSGNTVMCLLFAGISPESVGEAPFIPAEYFGKEYKGMELGLPLCEQVYIMPAVSGYVGGDITADLVCVMPECESGETLLLDIGTNGEIVLGHTGSFHCCATAAGPAFEGAEITMGMPAEKGAISRVYLESRRLRTEVIGNVKAAGICGSGLLDALSVFLDMGIVDRSGMIADAGRVSVAYRKYMGEYLGQACIRLGSVCVTQEDIRKLQLAKAAVAAGIHILMKERGITVSQIKRVLLAGGFGTYLNPQSAADIGLVPQKLCDVSSAVGNAAGHGAVSAAISQKAREAAAQYALQMKYVELALHPDFSDAYMDFLQLERW